MLRVSFDVDPESQLVTNIKVSNLTSKYDNINLPIVEVGNNKLILSDKAIKLISAKDGDRVAVNYIQKSNQITMPVIGKAETFVDRNAGNKLTKNNTVSFKGIQRTMLTKYGQLFELQEYQPGIFIMNPVDELQLAQNNLELVNEFNNLNLI